jgi:hypothetical protein
MTIIRGIDIERLLATKTTLNHNTDSAIAESGSIYDFL